MHVPDYCALDNRAAMSCKASESLRYGISFNDFRALMKLSNGDSAKLHRYAQRRRFKEPIAYIRGGVQFYGRFFKVDRRVYVPNPETEHLVKLVTKRAKKAATLLDVGTGSGCLAISVAKERPDLTVYASDIDPAALIVAQENAQIHDVPLRFFESHYADDLLITPPNYIISDMPYGDERYTLQSVDMAEFRHMPPQACFHPSGVLAAYRELISSIQRKHWTSTLYIETGRVDKKEVAKIIPFGSQWEYLPFDEYSVTIIYLEQNTPPSI